MPPLHVQNICHDLYMPLIIICRIHVHFLLRNLLNIFSSIACISTIALDKQRQEHNNLATI